jgi:nucleoside-diphosphate-sugar epimerase
MGRKVFVSGGAGYIGASLIPNLLERGHSVRALWRKGSEHKVASGAEAVSGNALDPCSFSATGCDTLVHLVGTPHPAPWKGVQFRAVDLTALRSSVAAAKIAHVSHIVYVSVAHPAPVMKSYIEVRMLCEEIIRKSGLRASILRPWYVLGPGHRWPVILRPAYWICERVPGADEAAKRLGLVTQQQMIDAILFAVEHPPESWRVLGVEDIRSYGTRPLAATVAPISC